MTTAAAAPLAIDLLRQAIERVRPYLNSSLPVAERIRDFWAGVVAARDRAAADVIESEFMRLARETRLAGAVGRHADEDLRHVVRWGMLNRDPFGQR